jgi:hypothetical protein
MALCLPLVQRVGLKLIVETAQCIECTIDGFSIPSVGSGDRSRHDPASNPACERRTGNAAISCRLLARHKARCNADL